MTHTDSCIAKDRLGQPQVFRAGQRVRIHADNCPQIDGTVATVRECFWQNQTTPGTEGMAVLLKELSWVFCRDVEPLGSEATRLSESIGESQGWGVFDVGGTMQVQRIDEAGLLANDDEAIRLARLAGVECDDDGNVAQ